MASITQDIAITARIEDPTVRAIAEAIARVSSEPDEVDARGKRVWRIRDARIPFTFDVGNSTRLQRASAAIVEGRHVTNDALQAVTRAVETPMPEGCCAVVECVASSTSVDWYGTEMTRACLDDQGQQCRAGVPLTESHGGFMSGPCDWDEVLGYTVDARVDPGAVAAPYDPTEPGYLMSITVPLYDVEESQELAKRCALGQPIGTSIGGWFVDVRVIVDEDGEVERILVERVELDHVAVTRRPANPDAKGMSSMRTRMGAALRERLHVDKLKAIGEAAAAKEASQADARGASEAGDTAATNDAAAQDKADAHADAIAGTPTFTPSHCSLAVTEDSAANRITFSLDPAAPDSDIAAAARAIADGLHGDAAARVLRTAAASVRPDPAAPADPPARADESDQLDGERATGHDAGEVPPADARRSAPPVHESSETHNQEQTTMPDNTNGETAVLLGELRRMNERIEALAAERAAPVAPTTPTESAEVIALRAQLAAESQARAAAEEAARRAMSAPNRRGLQGAISELGMSDRKNAIDMMIDGAATGLGGRRKMPTVARVAADNKDLLTISKREMLKDEGRSERFLRAEQALRDLCHGAFLDGVIKDPAAYSAWGD